MSFMDYVKSPFKMADSFFNPDKPYAGAEDQMRKYWQQAMGFMTPYNEAGKNQIGRLTGAEDALFDPAKLQSQWASGYETSPQALDLMRRSKELGNQEASSMGLSGSSSALENIQRTGSSIVSQDRQQYMNDLMQKYLSAIGIGQNMFNTGAGMGANLGQGALNTGRDMSGLEYGRLAAPGERMGQLIGAGAAMYGGGAGGGATLR